MATPLKAGDTFPEDVAFTYVPPSGKQEDVVACGKGIKYDASKGERAKLGEVKKKKKKNKGGRGRGIR